MTKKDSNVLQISDFICQSCETEFWVPNVANEDMNRLLCPVCDEGGERKILELRHQNPKDDNLFELLANIEHQRWADWQKYLHSLCLKNEDGSLTIPIDSVKYWERQIATPYSELTEKEKDSDREQVHRYWPHIEAAKDAEWDAAIDKAIKITNEESEHFYKIQRILQELRMAKRG